MNNCLTDRRNIFMVFNPLYGPSFVSMNNTLQFIYIKSASEKENFNEKKKITDNIKYFLRRKSQRWKYKNKTGCRKMSLNLNLHRNKYIFIYYR